jgi:hypothetical protein
VSPSIAALAVAYGSAPGTGRCAWWEEMLTIVPGLPLARKRRTVAQPVTASARLSVINSSSSVAGTSCQRCLAEDRRVVHPAGERSGSLGRIGGASRDGFIAGVAGHSRNS